MKRLAAALLLLLSAPAIAQDAPVETVTVNSLAGLWHGNLLQFSVRDGLFSRPKFGPAFDVFCRISPRQDALEISCLQLQQTGTVPAGGDRVHFAWGAMIFDGELVGAGHVRGHFQTKFAGITFENSDFTDARRVAPDSTAPDKAGKAVLLRRIIDDGLAGVPHDDEAITRNGGVTNPPKLGTIQAIAYLGQETKLDIPLAGGKPDLARLPNRPDFFSVYYVKFAEDTRLCGLHQREDGVLDGFRCV